MKNLVIMAAICLAAFSSCKEKGCTDPYAVNYNAEAEKDDGSCITAPNTRQALLTDKTATWCGPCGDYGTPLFEDILAANGSKVVGIALHRNDEMESTASNTLAALVNTSYIPTISIGLVDHYSGVNSATSAISAIAAVDPVATSSGSITVNGSSLTINAMARFLQAGSSGVTYKLATYILEDGIVAPQLVGSTYDDNYVHNDVLRAAATADAWGDPIPATQTSIGGKFQATYTVDAPATWNTDNLHVVTVIWKQVGGTHEFVNAF
jgi:hypothetical protein